MLASSEPATHRGLRMRTRGASAQSFSCFGEASCKRRRLARIEKRAEVDRLRNMIAIVSCTRRNHFHVNVCVGSEQAHLLRRPLVGGDAVQLPECAEREDD